MVSLLHAAINGRDTGRAMPALRDLRVCCLEVNTRERGVCRLLPARPERSQWVVCRKGVVARRAGSRQVVGCAGQAE